MRCLDLCLFALAPIEMDHLLENSLKRLITPIKALILVQAFLEVLYLLLYDYNLLPELINLSFVLVQEPIRVDGGLDWELMVPL